MNNEKSKGDFSNALQLDYSVLDSLFAQYKESAIYHRRFKHADIDSLIKAHETKNVLHVSQIGSSFEGRSISELIYGTGNIKVMLWSQMHGDEPTATMALFDLFNFLEGDEKQGEEIRTLLKDKLELHFIPMLNPDGAEIYNRRNAQSIDLNRDARVAHTVEGKILTKRAKEVKPSFGFNLHDQSIYYHVPNTKNPVTISLLAPAYNKEREINETRGNAMKIIAGINKVTQHYVPNSVAKYDDTHSPRGFGDNFQSWGASTVLIESGGLKGDSEKQQIRKINFAVILNALIEIAQGSYDQYDIDEYDDIPFNGSSLLHDVVIKNLEIGTEDIPLQADIAIRRAENTVDTDFFVRGWIEDLGDLSESFGYDEVDAAGMHLVVGKIYNVQFGSTKEITSARAMELLRQGYIAAKVAKQSDAQEIYDLPIQLFATGQFYPTTKIDLGGTANFFIADQANKLKYAVVNGYLIDLEKDQTDVKIKNRVN